MPHWKDKVALVTGASSGLGRAIATALVQAGAKVVLVARNAERLEETAAQLRALGGEVLTMPADITLQTDVDRLMAATIERFKRLDLLVNNAGRSMRGEVLSTTPEEFRDMLELNFISLVRCTRAAAPQLLESQGHVVNIGSLAAKSASRYVGAYPASKHAVAAYSQQLRLELGPSGLHVLLVCPGPITREEIRQYVPESSNLPANARKPGGGVRVKSIAPEYLAKRILQACERRQSELIIPAKARLLFVLSQLSPRLGDWLVRKMTK